MVVPGPFVAPSAEETQVLLAQRASVAPSGVHAPAPGQPRQFPDRQQRRQPELAALGTTMVRDRGELLQQRRQLDPFRRHRIGPLRLPGGTRGASAQPFSRSASQRIEVHPLEAAVELGVAAVAARKSASAPDVLPVSGRIQRAGELLRVDEGLGQFQRMAEGLLPVPAQAPQIGRHHTGGQVRDRPRWSQHQQPGVVGDQPQAGELLCGAPADPAVAGCALEGARLPTDQRQPALFVFGHIAQASPRESPESQIVMFVHGGVPPAALVGARQPEGDVSDRGGSYKVRFCHAGWITDPARKSQPSRKIPELLA